MVTVREREEPTRPDGRATCGVVDAREDRYAHIRGRVTSGVVRPWSRSDEVEYVLAPRTLGVRELQTLSEDANVLVLLIETGWA